MNSTSITRTITRTIGATAVTFGLLLSVPALAMDGGKLSRIAGETDGATAEKVVSSTLTSGKGTIGARMSAHPTRFGTR